MTRGLLPHRLRFNSSDPEPSPVRAVPRLALAVLLGLAAAAPLGAQQGDTVPAPPPAAPPPAAPHPEVREGPSFADSVAAPVEPRPSVSPLLPAEHWAVRAVSRAEALGLVRGWLPAQRSAPRQAVRAALDEAAVAAAARGDAGLAEMVEGWRGRFAEEFRSHAAAPESPLRVTGAAVRAGYGDWTGRLEPATGMYGYRAGPRALPDRSGATGGAALSLEAARHLAAFAEAGAGEEGVEVERWEVAAGWRSWTLSAGRMPVGYGVARQGGITLSGTDLERLELRTERPLRLPGFLRYLGPVSAHTAITRFDERRHPGEPYFWAMRAAFQAHPRFTVGINRASLFGGDSIDTPVTLRNVARMFLGVLSEDFENQVVSVDGRFRVPSERVLPLTLYLEWGSEDASGGWWNVPAITGGAWVPAVPGVPQLGVGAEYAHFDIFCCGNPPWYSHAGFPGNWVLEGRPLGHPLGGEGVEGAAYAVADLFASRLRLEARAFVRSRRDAGLSREERAGNLYAPERTGRSLGGTLEAAWRLAPRADLRATFFRDAGEDWAEQRMTADLAIYF